MRCVWKLAVLPSQASLLPPDSVPPERFVCADLLWTLVVIQLAKGPTQNPV